MKPVFIIFLFSFLLTFTAEMNAQTAQQNTPNTAKAATPPTSKPTTGTTKVKKPVKSTNKSNKGLFDDDFDGEVGIKYIGTEPVSEQELAKVQDAKRVDKSVKRTPKPVVQGETATTPAVKSAKVSKPMVQAPVTGTTEVQPAAATPTKVSKPVVKPEVHAETAAKPAAQPAKVVSKPVVKPAASEVTSKVVQPTTEVKPTPQVSAPVTQEVVASKAVEASPVVKTSKPVTRPAKPTTRGARIEFDAITINLGNVKEDAILERYFEFTNTGGSDLEILECRGSCGCVQPRALSTIVAPGEKGKILVKYTARNKVGPQRPVVTVTTNGAPSVIRLFVEAWVDQIPGGVKDTVVTPKGESN